MCAKEECKKRFWTAHDLDLHSKTVHGEKLFTCKEADCEKAFTTAVGLASHQLVHTEERPVHCEEKGCDKSFKSKKQLRLHMLYHSDERRYVCAVVDCDARFKTVSDRFRHQRVTHSEARPFKCTVAGCEQDYRYQQGLRAHMYAHNDDELPFKCKHEEYACPDSRCGGVIFGTVEQYIKHINDLHGANQLKAGYISSGGMSCTYASTSSSHLNEHVNRMHNAMRSRTDVPKETRFKSALETAGLRYEHGVEITFSGLRDTSHKRAWIDFKIYGRADGAIVISEVDQYQHKYEAWYSQACERRRLLDVVMALQIDPRFAGVRILWIRYNPDPYKYNNKRVTKSLGTREEAIVKVIKEMALPADGRLLTLLYMFYDSITDPGTGKPQACVLLDDEEVPEMLFDCAIPAVV